MHDFALPFDCVQCLHFVIFVFINLCRSVQLYSSTRISLYIDAYSMHTTIKLET